MAQDAKVEVFLDQSLNTVDVPVSGTIVITHPPAMAIENSSFTYEGKRLPVDFLRKVTIPGNESLSVDSYRFKLAPFSEGSQTLSPVSVKVGGKSISSSPLLFEVRARNGKAAPGGEATLLNSPRKASLKIEKIFFPKALSTRGQKILVGYRYLFEGDIDLQEEDIPLLDQTIFHKLGEKVIADRQDQNLSIREITQTIEVEKPGVYEIPKSLVTGYAVLDKGWGPKTYFEPKLVSEIPSFKIEVKPFPEKGKPPFFSDAIGPFKISSRVQKPPKLEVGDKFLFEVIFSGEGVLSTIKPPNLLCQPGWSGFFQVGDLPPQGQSKTGEVVFQYELRPLTSPLILEGGQIPPVWFAYFNPSTATYEIISTSPVELAVAAPPPSLSPPAPPPEEITLKAIPAAPQGIPPQEIAEWENGVNRELEGLLTGMEKGGAHYFAALGSAFSALERYPEAIWAYQTALSIFPWNSEVKRRLYEEQEKLFLFPMLWQECPSLSYMELFFYFSF